MLDWTGLKARADLLKRIRSYFDQSQVLEVDTPILAQVWGVDEQISLPETQVCGRTFTLQSSPELAMKRLLVAGSGDIYQMGKVFRDGELGRKHAPEFTLLEWYRLGFDLQALMQDVADLMAWVGFSKSPKQVTYASLWQPETFLVNNKPCEAVAAVNPHLIDDDSLHAFMLECIEISGEVSRNDCLDLLFSHCIEPTLGFDQPTFITQYPASQAALAKISQPAANRPHGVAERFELVIEGVEIANGYHELTDLAEQKQRFGDQAHGAGVEAYLDALEQGLPACSGVALGVDRLLMLLTGRKCIQNVLPLGGDLV